METWMTNMVDQDLRRSTTHGKGAAGVSPAPQPPAAVGPRISFSGDFSLDAAGRPAVRYERPSAASAPPSTDFEFSVGSHRMMAADELFSRGRLLPLREAGCSRAAPAPHAQIRTTLREELLAGEGEEELTFSPSPPPSGAGLMAKVPLKWKTMMGLRKGNSDDKKHGKESR